MSKIERYNVQPSLGVSNPSPPYSESASNLNVSSSSGTVTASTATTTVTTTTPTSTGGMTFAQRLYASALPTKYVLPTQSPGTPQSQVSGPSRPGSASSNASGSGLSASSVEFETLRGSASPPIPEDSVYSGPEQSIYRNPVAQRPGQNRPAGARLPGRSASATASVGRVSPITEGTSLNGPHRTQSYQAGTSHASSPSASSRPRPTSMASTNTVTNVIKPYEFSPPDPEPPEVVTVLRPPPQSPSMPVPTPGMPSPMLSEVSPTAPLLPLKPTSPPLQQQIQNINSGMQGQSQGMTSPSPGSSVGYGQGASSGMNVGPHPQSPTPSTHSFSMAGASPTSVGTQNSYGQPASPGQGIHAGSVNGSLNAAHQQIQNQSQMHAPIQTPMQAQTHVQNPMQVPMHQQQPSSNWGAPMTPNAPVQTYMQAPVQQQQPSSNGSIWGAPVKPNAPVQMQTQQPSSSGSIWGTPHTHNTISANMAPTQTQQSSGSFFSSFWGKPVNRPPLHAQQSSQSSVHSMSHPSHLASSPAVQQNHVHQSYLPNASQPQATAHMSPAHQAQHNPSGLQIGNNSQSLLPSTQGVSSPPVAPNQNANGQTITANGIPAYGMQMTPQTPSFSQQTQIPSTNVNASPSTASAIAGQLGRFAARVAANYAKRTVMALVPNILSGLAAAVLPSDLIQSVSDSLGNLDLTNTGIDPSQLQAAFQGSPQVDYQSIINQMQQLQQSAGNNSAGVAQNQSSNSGVNYSAIIHALTKISQAVQSQGQTGGNHQSQGQGQMSNMQHQQNVSTGGFMNQQAQIHHQVPVQQGISPAATQQNFQSQTPMHNPTQPVHTQIPQHQSQVQPQYHPQQQTNPPRPSNAMPQQMQAQYHPPHQATPPRPPNTNSQQQSYHPNANIPQQPQYHPQQQANPPRPPNTVSSQQQAYHANANAPQQQPYRPPQQQPHHPANASSQQQTYQSPQQQQQQSYPDSQSQTDYQQQQSYPQDQDQYQDPNQYQDQSQYALPDSGYQNQDQNAFSLDGLPNYSDQSNPGYETQDGQQSSQSQDFGLSSLADSFQNMMNNFGNTGSGGDGNTAFGDSGFGQPSYGDPNSDDVSPPAFSEMDPNAMGMGNLDGSFASVSVSETDMTFVDGSGGGFEFSSETITATLGSDVFTETMMSLGDGNYTTVTELSYSAT